MVLAVVLWDWQSGHQGRKLPGCSTSAVCDGLVWCFRWVLAVCGAQTWCTQAAAVRVMGCRLWYWQLVVLDLLQHHTAVRRCSSGVMLGLNLLALNLAGCPHPTDLAWQAPLPFWLQRLGDAACGFVALILMTDSVLPCCI